MNEQNLDLITLTIDDLEVSVPKGTVIIEAAKQVHAKIPHYCYHKSLSIVGNCRMCQVEVEGAPKLMIACHTQVQPGMKVRTHQTSDKVREAQASTLEMILINHPLDCTVCDQAGHCKLQDYHFEYNAQPSRFIETKVSKVKAEPLGPTVMLDAERCIMCTRCIRFCDEVTKTSELGMVNRGDRSMISINPGKELNNPFSGNVVDLCPVGALTHKQWRFNTRIWYTKQVDTICTGCSTGCSVKLAIRDNQVVHVKSRPNSATKQDWLCDEGRYGFHRFIPKHHLKDASVKQQVVSIADALNNLEALKSNDTAFLLAPDLFLEDFYLVKKFRESFAPEAQVAVAYRGRSLTELEKILISPDYAANFRSAQYLGLISDNPESDYQTLLNKIYNQEIKNLVLVGDRAIDLQDLNSEIVSAITKLSLSVAIIADADSALRTTCNVVLPSRSVYQKAGLMISNKLRLQYSERLLDFDFSTHPHWRYFEMLASKFGKSITLAKEDREMTLALLAEINADPSDLNTNLRLVRKQGLEIAFQ